MKKSIIAMILVGGIGSRLQEITKDTAKPAVSFGAKYRLIDFTLSNITNSDIDCVGLVTQYEPYELMNYIGSGASWDLDVVEGGIHFLTPYTKKTSILWQKGTANAISRYLWFAREFDADFVLVLSGDQIYKMDYRKLWEHHLNHNADITIASTRVPLDDASRFGILTVDEKSRVLSFAEKPEHPESDLASMGIYLFNTETLTELLSGSTEASLDFGMNIIPKSLRQKKTVSAYQFEGYWRDVGTVESLYKANMDMLDDPTFLGLNVSRNLPVYSKSLNLPPHIALKNATITDSVVADGSVVGGTVRHSSIGYECIIKTDAFVEDAILLPGVVVGKGARIKNVVVNRNTVIPDDFRFQPDTVTLVDSSNLERLVKDYA